MAKKGLKSLRGQAETEWGETKSAQLKVQLTPTGKRLLLERIQNLKLSIAEFLERIGRGTIEVVLPIDSGQDFEESEDRKTAKGAKTNDPNHK